MLPRLRSLRRDLKVTFIYGADSWIDPLTSHDQMENIEHYQVIKFYTIENAGHHVYADQYK